MKLVLVELSRTCAEAEGLRVYMTNSPEGTRKDLLPPSKIDQDSEKPRSKAQEDTLSIINSGILPHSNSERFYCRALEAF